LQVQKRFFSLNSGRLREHHSQTAKRQRWEGRWQWGQI